MKMPKYPFPTSRNNQLRQGSGLERVEESLTDIVDYIYNQQDDINTKLAAAEAAAEQAGEYADEAFSGTPDGYDALVADVGDLKTSYNVTLIPLEVSGLIFNRQYIRDNGALGSSNTTCSAWLHNTRNGIVEYIVPEGFVISAVAQYSSGESSAFDKFIIKTDVSSIKFRIDNTKYYVISVRFAAHTTITLTDIPDDAKKYTLYVDTDTSLTQSGKAADAKAVGDIVNDLPTILPKSAFNLNHLLTNYFGIVPDDYYTGHISDYSADGFDADTDYNDIIAKFDTLVDNGYVTKTDLGVSSDEVNHLYEYDFIPTKCPFTGTAAGTKTLPTILIISGQHGFEKASIYGLYYFLKDLCTVDTDPVLTYLKSQVNIKVIPACNPYGINNNSYTNANGVNINRNYNTPGFVAGGTPGDATYGGESPNSEAETKIICSFITNNPNTLILIDFHTNGKVSVSDYDDINWISFPAISDDWYDQYRWMGCSHIERITQHFIKDYSLTIPYGTLCGRCTSGADGYTATFPSADVWSLEHGVTAHTLEGFTGFPSGTAYSDDALKANSEILGNWILNVLYGSAKLH